MKTERILACLFCALASCISTNDPQHIRFFAVDPAPQAESPSPASSSATFRLRRSSAAMHLRERMVWRRSAVEYGFSEDRRWTELPIEYVERAILDDLVRGRGLQRSEAPGAPALDLELLAFDEVLAPEHVARVVFNVRLVGADGATLLDRRIEGSQPIEDVGAEAVVRAIADALSAAILEAGDSIEEALAPISG